MVSKPKNSGYAKLDARQELAAAEISKEFGLQTSDAKQLVAWFESHPEMMQAGHKLAMQHRSKEELSDALKAQLDRGKREFRPLKDARGRPVLLADCGATLLAIVIGAAVIVWFKKNPHLYDTIRQAKDDAFAGISSFQHN